MAFILFPIHGTAVLITLLLYPFLPDDAATAARKDRERQAQERADEEWYQREMAKWRHRVAKRRRTHFKRAAAKAQYHDELDAWKLRRRQSNPRNLKLPLAMPVR